MEKLLSRVKNIILSPKSEWQAIKSEQTTVKDIMFNYVAILAAIPPIASIIGMGIVGFSFMGSALRYPLSYLIVWGIIAYIMSIVSVLVAGAVINALAPTFASRKDNVRAVQVAAYSLTPAWIAGIFNVVPVLGILVILASLYSMYLLYAGLKPLMETPEDKAVGYSVVSIIAVIVIIILVDVLVSAVAGIFFFTGGMGMGKMHP
jgi:hypothetical protein